MQVGGHLAIIAERDLRADAEMLGGKLESWNVGKSYNRHGQRDDSHRPPPGRANGTTLSATCWRRRVFSWAISVLRREICSRSSWLYRMLPRAGCGAGLRSVMTNPARMTPPPIRLPSRSDVFPRSPLEKAEVPASAIPVYASASPIGFQLLGGTSVSGKYV